MKNDRMMAITLHLLNKGKTSSAKLANKFEVSERTIYRDIESLCMAGIPISAVPGRSGGYEILENFTIEKGFFSTEEIQMLLSMLRGMRTAFSDDVLAAVEEKIRALLSPGQPDTGSVHVFLNPYGMSVENNIRLKILRDAIKNKKCVRIDYLDYQGKESSRIIEPLALLCYGISWYLYAYCRLREDYRLFRLTRLTGLEVLQENVLKREINLDERPWEKFWGESQMLELQLRFSPRVKVRVYDSFPRESITIDSDGFYLVKANYPDDDWITSFLLSFGSDLMVLSPEKVKTRLADEVNKIVNYYLSDNTKLHSK